MCSNKEIKEVEEVEEQVQKHMREMSNEEVLDDVEDWVEDPFYNRMRETKYFRLSKLIG